MPAEPLQPLLDPIIARDLAIAGEHEQALLAEINRANAERLRADNLQFANAVIEAHAKELAAELAAEKAKHEPPPLRPRLVFPVAAGDVDLRLFGAKGDGVFDDTAAIQWAISGSIGKANKPARIRLFGRHLVTNTLEWRSAAGGWRAYGILCGAGATTGLVLPPNCPGFTDPSKPRAIVTTGNNPWPGMAAEHIEKGTGFAAFQNFLADLTIEIGPGNAGAVGVNLRANNVGGLDNVSVIGPGYCGVSIEDKHAGPLLLDRVVSEQCAYGLRVGKDAGFYSVTARRSLFHGTTADILNDGLLSVEWVDGKVTGKGRVFEGDESEPVPEIPTLPPTPPDADGTWTVGDRDTLVSGWFSPGQMATPPAGKARINHVGPGTLYVVHFQGGAGETYRAGPGCGPVVILDAYTTGGVWRFGKQRIRAWQFNPEAPKAKTPAGAWAFPGPKVVLDGTDFRVVGLKVEGPGDLLKAVNGAKVKVVGGIVVANVPMTGATLFDLSADATASIELVADGSAAVQVKRGGAVAVPAKATRSLLKYSA